MTPPCAARYPPAVTGPTASSVDLRPMRTLWLVSLLHAANHAIGFLGPLVYIAVAAEFTIGADTIAFLSATGAFAAGFLQLGFSELAKIATRRVLLGVGGVIMGGFMALQAAMPAFLPFAVTNVVSRLGGAPQHPVGNALLSEQFPAERRGFAISAHIAGGNIGTLLVPLAGAWSIAANGWRPTVVVVGIAAAAISVMVIAFVRESSTDRATAKEAGGFRDGIRTLWADRDLRWLFLSSALGSGGRGLGIVSLFALLHLSHVVRVDTVTTNLMYAVILAFSIPGPLVAGWLSDRYGRKPLIYAAYLGGAIAFVAFPLAGSNVALLWLAVLLIGVFSFIESPQQQALLADMVPGPQRDVAFSVFFTLAFVAASAWTAGYGAIIGILGEPAGLPAVFVVMAAAFVLAAVAMVPVRRVR